jgi:vacuolar-type H+-ATPase subunit I/STV1
MTYLRVKDRDHLLRDVNSNGIVNADETEYKNYVNNYVRQLNSKNKIEELEQQVDEIKTDVKEIKDLILKLLNS